MIDLQTLDNRKDYRKDFLNELGKLGQINIALLNEKVANKNLQNHVKKIMQNTSGTVSFHYKLITN